MALLRLEQAWENSNSLASHERGRDARDLKAAFALACLAEAASTQPQGSTEHDQTLSGCPGAKLGKHRRRG